MASHRAKNLTGAGGRGRGRTITAAQVERNILKTAQALHDRLEVAEIAALLSCSETTAYEYIARVRRRWAEHNAAELPELKVMALADLRRDVDAARKMGDMGAVSSLQRTYRQIEGTLPVGKGVVVGVNLNAQVQATPEQQSLADELAEMTPEERLELGEALSHVRQVRERARTRRQLGAAVEVKRLPTGGSTVIPADEGSE